MIVLLTPLCDRNIIHGPFLEPVVVGPDSFSSRVGGILPSVQSVSKRSEHKAKSMPTYADCVYERPCVIRLPRATGYPFPDFGIKLLPPSFTRCNLGC
uniref:Uncharacterized protein n=1 Tax=Knipowitschia caucasica TaxID=637954 RepID=A0AAV2MAG4_KNICA